MKQYQVRMTVQAEENILEYAEYIMTELLNPQTAVKFVEDMRLAVKSLSFMPQRNPLVDEEPWRKMGIYKMVVRGYIIYYWVDNEMETVHVTGVVYGKRNQEEQLTAMDFE